MEIIILIAVIGLIGNIIKAMNKPQQTTPQQNPMRKIFKDIKVDPISSNDKMQRSMFQVPEEPRNISLESTDKGHLGSIGRGKYGLNLSKTSDAIQEVSLDEGQSSQFDLKFSQDNILNGIIFSEILGPPKSQRR